MKLFRVWAGLASLSFAACTAQMNAQVPPTLADVEAAPEAWRQVDRENLVIMETSKGRIVLELLPEIAPDHVVQFREYVRDGSYNGTEFHRAVKDFMIQGGDVEAKHGPEKMKGPLDAEFTLRRSPVEDFAIDAIGPDDSARAGFYKGFPIRTQAQFLAEMSIDGRVDTWMPHCAGVLSSARTDDPNSANAQFFIISKNGRHLDKEYTAKGRVLEGLDVVKKIKLGPWPEGYPIRNPDVLRTAVLASELPAAESMTAYVQKTTTEEWVNRRVAADRTEADICSLPPVPAVIVE